MTRATKSKVASLVGPAENRKKLGYVIWWSVEHALLVGQDKVKKAFEGFEDKDMPQVMDNEVAFTQSSQRAKVSKEFDGWIIRKINLTDEKVVVGIVNEKVDKQAEELDYKKEDKITLMRNTGDVLLENSIPNGKIMKDIYLKLRNKVDARMLMHYLLKAIGNMASMCLREMGGIYFVPISYEDRVSAIEKAVAQLSPGTNIYLLPIYDDDRSKKSLKTVFDEELKTEVESITTKFKEMTENENTRPSTFTNRLEELKALRQKVETYENLLTFKADDAKKGIASLEVKIGKYSADGRLSRKVDLE